MARIIPKLNLNKTPQLAEPNSLIFAKNIMLNKEGSIQRDNGFEELLVNPFTIGQAILDKNDQDLYDRNRSSSSSANIVLNKIIKIIPYNNILYILVELKLDSIILSYNEKLKTLTYHPTGWRYNKGIVSGNIVTNLKGEVILTIAESNNPFNLQVPLKSINLNKAKKDDDESIYTNAPKINITNLICIGRYSKSIPNGVYQFFIRYKISDNNYTNWIPASVELYAGNTNELFTHQGNIKYLDTNLDSNDSFILKVEKLVDTSIYKEFQVGFLISHDDENYARAWKHFDINVDTIYFDYDTEFIEELDIKDLLNQTYNLYSVGNVTSFKNKQYISNYKETNFNTDLQEYASKINISLIGYPSSSSWKITSNDGVKYIVNEYDSVNNTITRIENQTINELILNCITSNDTLNTIFTNFENSTIKSLVSSVTYNSSNSFVKVTVECSKKADVIKEVIEESEELINKTSYFKINNDSYERYEYKKDYSLEIINNYVGRNINTTTNSVTPNIVTLHRYDYKSFIKRDTTQGLKNQIVYSAIDIKVTVSSNLRPNTIEYNTTNVNEGPSLIPLQTYKFYVHYISKFGEITNGYNIGTLTIENGSNIEKNNGIYNIPQIGDNGFDVEDMGSNVYRLDSDFHTKTTRMVIKPKFTNINIPKNYVACFISIEHTNTNFIDVCNLKGSSTILGDIPEALLRIYNNYNSFIVDNGQFKINGQFKHSGDATNLVTFGSSGKFISVDSSRTTSVSKFSGYVLEPYNKNLETSTLIKCTNFITEQSYIPKNDENINLLGFVSAIKLLNDNSDKYVSGTDIYNKTVSEIGIAESINLKQDYWDEYINNVPKITYCYTHYNFKYLSLTNDNDFVPKSVTQQKQLPAEGGGLTTITEKRVVIAKDSILLSETYKLSDMYKNITRLTYIAYKENHNDITEYNNTIRSSRLNSEEDNISRFTFDALDYYHVPVNKGIIVNLVSIGNAILVHTKDSMFKFSGNNTITANGGENISLKEGEIFDTGITEVFGSQHGFGGLSDKNHTLITEAGYIFYDKDSNIIYMYAGEGQITPISDNIEKLLDNVKNIIFSSDYYKNRFFVEIIYNNNDALTLSYNYKTGSFISIHDFVYTEAFNSKVNCYFIFSNKIFLKSDSNNRIPSILLYHSTKYPKFSINNKPAVIVDIIVNDYYESVKTLNSVNWIVNEVLDFKSTDINVAEEQLNEWYSGNYIYIYSDSCNSEIIDISNNSNNETLIKINDKDYTVVNPNSYQKPRFNLGFWTFNYFRNIKHATADRQNVYNQDNSLIYGKYLIIRFMFDSDINFKLENLTLNYSYQQ